MPRIPPRFPEDYADAALRHWQDAVALGESRKPAADHHIGIAAECALKHAISRSNSGGTLDEKMKKHADRLWNEATAALDVSLFADLCITLAGSNPFAAWQIDDRYAGTEALTADIEFLENGVSRRETRRRITGVILRQAGLML